MNSRRLLGGRRPAGPKRIGGAAPGWTRLPAQPAPARPAALPSAGRVLGSLRPGWGWCGVLTLLVTTSIALDASEAGSEWSVTLPALVEADRARVAGLLPPAQGLVVAWHCTPGSRLERGDAVVVWDSRGLQQQAEQAELDLLQATSRLRRGGLNNARELHELEAERDAKRHQLVVAEAKLADLLAEDAATATLRRGELEMARLAWERRTRAAQASAERAARGELSGQALEREQAALAKAERATALPQWRLEDHLAGADPATRAGLELRCAGLRAELGIDAAGNDLDAGLVKRLAGLRSRIEAEQAQDRASYERALAEQRKALRLAWDHTPLRAVRFLDGAGVSLLRVVFAPEDVSLAGDERRDVGGVWDPSSGQGWNRDARSEVVRRTGGRKRGGQSSGQPSGLALIRGEARWRCRLPPDATQVAIELGDEVEWQGAVVAIRIPGAAAGPAESWQCLAAIDILPAGQREVLGLLPAGLQELELRCGDGHGAAGRKAQRAPEPGLGSPQDWLRVGMRVSSWWDDWPASYFTPADALRVRAVLPQDLAPVIARGGGVVDGSHRLALQQAAQTAHLLDRDPRFGTAAELGGATVLSVGQQPVPLDPRMAVDQVGEALDLLGRELLLQPDAAARSALLPGLSVQVRLRWMLPPGWQVLPGHLLEAVGNGARMRWRDPAGNEVTQEVAALRLGGDWLLPQSVPPGVALMPALLDQQLEPGLPGVVAAGRRRLVNVGPVWGRVVWQVPAGSTVAAGEVVMRLDNPDLQLRAAERQESATRARQQFLVALRERRLKTAEELARHQARQLAEQQAALALVQARQVPEEEVRRTAAALADAQAVAAQEHAHAAEWDGLGWPREAALATLAATRSALRLRRATIDAYVGQRRPSWLAQRRADAAWRAAQDELAGREGAQELIRREEVVARLLAADRLRRSLADDAEQRFARYRELRAPVAGRLFWLETWNDQSDRMTTVGPGFAVWYGMAVGEVLDVGELVLECAVPETRLAELKVGGTTAVVFGQWGASLPGRIASLGQAVLPAPERARADRGSQAVGIDRIVPIRVAFAPPPELAAELVPGTKGRVVLP